MAVCKVCAVSFACKDALVRHVKSVHTKRKFVCDICGKSYSRKYNLNRHIVIFHPNARRESVIQFAGSALIVSPTPMQRPVINTDLLGGGEFSEKAIADFENQHLYIIFLSILSLDFVP